MAAIHDTPTRWLIHATNGWGIGHIARTVALARQIRARAPASQILFFTNSEAANLIWQEGFAAVKVPSYHANQSRMISADISVPLSRIIAAGIFAAFRPQVIVADVFPQGGNNELSPLLHRDALRVLIHREVRPEIRESDDMIDMMRPYHVVLVPHRPGETDLALPEGVAAKEVGSMLIRSRHEALPKAAARRRLGLPQDGFLVYLGFGGGGDFKIEELFGRLFEKTERHADWTFVHAVGPLQRGAPLPERPNVRAVRYFPLAEVWSAFDAAITMRGTNTVNELLHNGIPVILLPAHDHLVDDQAARGDRIAKAKAGWLLNSLDDPDLDAALAAVADSGWREGTSANARELVPENGAELAADYLLDFLAKTKIPPTRPAAR